MGTKLRSGINHIEFWISDLKRTIPFYESFLKLVGWQKISDTSFSDGSMVIYFLEKKDVAKMNSLGIRHICFQATDIQQIELVYKALMGLQAEIIRGPLFMPYSDGYFTVDFYDPDGQVIEVAYTP